MAKVGKELERRLPGPNEVKWTAVENGAEIRSAVKKWKRALASEAEVLQTEVGETLWLPRQKFWAHFDTTKPIPRRRRQGNYWNVFGLTLEKTRHNMAVEINPPISGKNTNVQGVVARDNRQALWVLHGGRLHSVTAEKFDAVYPGKRVVVQFSDGTTFRYHPVAKLDGTSSTLASSLSVFIQQCRRVRDYYTDGPEVADVESRANAAEDELSGEFDGKYVLPGREEKIVERVHGSIWKALDAALRRAGVKCSSRRIGRFGPDLLTKKPSKRILFEIKRCLSPSAIYEGFGQLYIYDAIAGGDHEKVLVLPAYPKGEIARILRTHNVGILTFKAIGRRILFNSRDISALLGSHRHP